VNTPFLIAGLCACWSISAAAQVTGEFYLDKDTFVPGEPVFLYFKLSNNSLDAIQLASPDIDQPFCSGTSITVTNDPPPAYSCHNFADSGCVINGALRPLSALQPGQSNTQRFLLNFNHEINAPGDYQAEAAHNGMPPGAGGEAKASLHFRVDGDAAAYPPAKLQPWLDSLKSNDQAKRIESAQTLASLAPLWLEDTLLGFAANPEFRRYAPLALHRLKTPRSIEALADMVKATGPGTWEQMEAARYLAMTGDQQWYPLLLDAAVKNGKISNYPAYAAELGGDKMLPVLVDLAKNPDTRLQAVMAMGSTASRTALPILLQFLRSPDLGTSQRAAGSLSQLTHRTGVQLWPKVPDPQTEYTLWTQWWQREGATAQIYKETDCGEMVPLS
jgi:hypothetical protein